MSRYFMQKVYDVESQIDREMKILADMRGKTQTPEPVIEMQTLRIFHLEKELEALQADERYVEDYVRPNDSGIAYGVQN